MNNFVPDFEMDEDSSIPSSSALTKQSGDDEILQLLCQSSNAPISVLPLDQHPLPKLPSSLPSTESYVVDPLHPSLLHQYPPPSSGQLYMADEEMATWLHQCPLEEFYGDFLYTNPPITVPPPQPTVRWAAPPTCTRGFSLFSKMAGSSNIPESLAILRPSVSTVVDSSDTPITSGSNIRVGPNVVAPIVVPPYAPGSVVVTSTNPAVFQSVGDSLIVGEGTTEGTKLSTSSSSATNSAATATTATTTAETSARTTTTEAMHRKRKSKEIEETAVGTSPFDPQNEEVEVESGDEKKHLPGSSASKRTRAAEVHNLSERRRRDRINEKMKALQELIPRCNKSDKASMLDEAIEYLKSLQMQVQMMAMGCGMIHPGMQQQYMPPMGMGVDMGMARPVMPYPPTIPAPSALQTSPAANTMSPLAPRMPVPPYVMPSVPGPLLSVSQPRNPADPSSSPYTLLSPGMTQIPNMADPYQQYLAYQQMQMHMQMQMQMHVQMQAQSQTLSQPGSSKPGTSKSEGDNEDDFQ